VHRQADGQAALIMSTDSKVLHRIIRQLATWALSSFFTEIRVIGGENVPTDGPIIVYVDIHSKEDKGPLLHQ
jgi:hypothetical protein